MGQSLTQIFLIAALWVFMWLTNRRIDRLETRLRVAESPFRIQNGIIEIRGQGGGGGGSGMIKEELDKLKPAASEGGAGSGPLESTIEEKYE